MKTITPEERQIILDFCLQNPDKTVQEVMDKYKVCKDIAFNIVKEAGNKLGRL
uniref:Uncharacterized protein n=1 Tax=viral metagenome TaxID=1070528 RepID=A0A6H1ZJ89_9ZZZZ